LKKFLCEFIGTFILVFIGCGAAAAGGEKLGLLGIGLAFGFAIIAAAYSIGHISGAHVNPAVSIGMFTAGRMSAVDLIGYIISQFLGAIVAAMALVFILKGQLVGYDFVVGGLGQNGWGAGYGAGYDRSAAIMFELIASFLFIMVILESTQENVPNHHAGIAIGITLAALVIVGLQITGTSVNPARSFGPAFVLGGHALKQVWLFLIYPTIGGIIAGLFYRFVNACNKD